MRIAFLFITRDNLNQPELWNDFFSISDKYIIKAHAKYPEKVTQNIIKDNIIPKYIKTEWGDASLILVMITLLMYGLKDGADRLIFLSESCVPLQTFSKIRDILSVNNESWFCSQNMDKSEHKKRYNSLSNPKFIKYNELHKSSQWCILNKTDAIDIVKSSSKYYLNFKNFIVPDEHYILTILNKIYNDKYNKKYKYNSKESTFIDWIRHSEDYKHPHTFDILTDFDVKLLKKTNSLFARKFSKESDILKYINYIQNPKISYYNMKQCNK